jgi:starch synthase
VFASTLKRAIHRFHHPEDWRQIQLNGMQQDFSWENSARKYVELYVRLRNKN